MMRFEKVAEDWQNVFHDYGMTRSVRENGMICRVLAQT